MERLNMNQILDVVYRLRKGETERSIVRTLGYHRKTVRRYREIAAWRGFLDLENPLPSPEELLAAIGEPVTSRIASSCVTPYASLVEEWLDRGVSVRAIFRLLVERHGFTGSYSAVRRFVADRHPAAPDVCVRVETKPGEEAQVDFGTTGLLRHSDGRDRTAYCFVMTLSYSRHQYVEFVFDQKMATWISCHVRAFESFGGTPERIVVDNLKAAVLKAALEDPELSVPYERMARHYDLLIHNCRPRTPQHKGKVESGVNFVKRNLWPGLAPTKNGSAITLATANAEAAKWVAGYAGHRTHGTTGWQPLPHFLEHEKAALRPLPKEPFELLEVRMAKLHRDCHVVVEGSYYSAPHEHVGKRLEVHIHRSTVQIYDGLRLLVTHPRAGNPGERLTRTEDYPDHKANWLKRASKEYCAKEAERIGRSCAHVVDAILGDRPKDCRRALAALIGLADKYGDRRLEAACRCAIAWGDPCYIRVKNILRDCLDDRLEEHGLDEDAGRPDGSEPRTDVAARALRFARRAADFAQSKERGGATC